jgi:hypothetical protein
MAQVLRASDVVERPTGSIVVESIATRLRITIGAGAERETAIAMLGVIVAKEGS